jgi:hypothetical protein
MGEEVGVIMEMSADGQRKGGGESKAERWPKIYFGVIKQCSSLSGTLSS